MIRATNLTKLYGGRPALNAVTFEISDGETVGFLGLNGAGKTTALRLLACDLRPSAGTIEVGGIDAIAEPHEVRKRIGFLPENPPLYLDLDSTGGAGLRLRDGHCRDPRSIGEGVCGNEVCGNGVFSVGEVAVFVDPRP